jgi:NADH:ubiquinone oxidoreductase subunit K
MILLAVVAFAMGLLGKPRLALLPFVAANLALVATLAVVGVAASLSFRAMALDAVVALAAAQSGYVVGLALETRRSRRRPSAEVGSTGSSASKPDDAP